MANSLGAENLITQIQRDQRSLGLQDGMREDEVRGFGVALVLLVGSSYNEWRFIHRSVVC